MAFFPYNQMTVDSLIYHKFAELHEGLYSRIRSHNWDLHPRPQKSEIISTQTVATVAPADTLTLSYLRAPEQAELVERLMGKESGAQRTGVDIYRHPVIELRWSPGQFVVELIVSPYAWWDQQNFIGKLTLERHRNAFRALLRRMDGDYRFGFWDGIHLSDMHMIIWQLLRGNVLDEWMGTFADGQDWLRVGIWYDLSNGQLDDCVIPELTRRVKELYELYNFILWTSNNNFHRFYEKRQPASQRRYA